MWSSIQQILKPESLEEAVQLQKEASSALMAGGSYLVSKRDESIHTLIDIRHLLLDTAEQTDGGLLLGAGISLQDLLSVADESLSQAITASTPSKNIRNQRTLGGEIAEARTDSDLMVYLNAADAQIQLNEVEIFVHVCDWAGMGVISKVFIPAKTAKLERVSVLDSAPAFVIASVLETETYFSMAVGGKSEKIAYCRTSNPPEETDLRQFLDEVEAIFAQDHFGAPVYKRQLVSRLLHEMTKQS